MRNIFKVTPEERNKYYNIIGHHYVKYRVMMIVFAAFVAIVALANCIYWEYDENSAGLVEDYLYLATHITYLITSLVILILFVLNKYKKVNHLALAITAHVYGFVIIALATLDCVMDLTLGISPLLYILVCTMIAGLFVIEPRFFIITVSASILSIGLYAIKKPYTFFEGNYMAENIITSAVYIIVIVLICIRHFRVTTQEYEAKEELERLTYYDGLTGLLNERSYMLEVDKLAEARKNGTLQPYAVIMLDVNNLKATNDQYGHHFGSHLIIHCAELLPAIFKTSKLFHVGGDEFIVIAKGDDLNHLDERMKFFDEIFEYSIIQFEENNLIFSIARGYSVCQDGDKFLDVLQRADEAMYENKKMLKEKYGLVSR